MLLRRAFNPSSMIDPIWSKDSVGQFEGVENCPNFIIASWVGCANCPRAIVTLNIRIIARNWRLTTQSHLILTIGSKEHRGVS